MKQLLLLLALISPSFAKLPTIDYAGMFFQVSPAQPIRKVASLPATCTAVGAASSSNAVLYQGRVYQCTATDTWTFAVGVSSALTAGRLPYVGTGGILADSANATLSSLGVLAVGGTTNGGSAQLTLQGYSTNATNGIYGRLYFNANNNMSSDARQWLVTNATTAFRIIRSVDSGTPITLNTTGTVTSGTVDFSIDHTGLIATSGMIKLGAVAFATLGTPSNGTIAYCSDCAKATPCAGSGSGALAKRINGAWDCD